MSLPDFIFPQICLGCGKKGAYFCPSCSKLFESRRKQICPACCQFSFWGVTHPGCLDHFSLDGLISLCCYRGVVRRAIKKLKYRFVTDLAEELVSLIVRMIEENQAGFFPKLGSGWILTPVPLHPRRERWRGFNQSALLGEMISEKMAWQFCSDVLMRHKYGKPQAEVKEKEERQANVYGVFKTNPNSKFVVHNSEFILFDDVWTTGSTMKECGRVLKEAGAKKVWGLVIAR